MRVDRVPDRLLSRLQRWVEKQTARRYEDFPLGRTPRASADEYRRLADAAATEPAPAVDDVEKEWGYAIDATFLHELALHTQIVIKKSPLSYHHGRVLYAALRRMIDQNAPQRITIVETGTARGFSAVCMAKALADSRVPGTLVTFDVLPHHVPMYWNCIDDTEGPKSRAQLLGPWHDLLEGTCVFHRGDSLIELPKLKVSRINLAFLDGVHTYEYVMGEFHLIAAAQREGDVVVFDDYSPDFEGVRRAVDEIGRRYAYRLQLISADGRRGYVVATRSTADSRMSQTTVAWP